MNDLKIPSKCEECGKRRPSVVVFGTGIGRDFSRVTFSKFICGECLKDEKGKE